MFYKIFFFGIFVLYYPNGQRITSTRIIRDGAW